MPGYHRAEGYGLFLRGCESLQVWDGRHYGYAYRLAPAAYLLEDGAHDASVEAFDGLQLQLQVAVVSCFVAGFHVEEYEVVLAEGFEQHVPCLHSQY